MKYNRNQPHNWTLPCWACEGGRRSCHIHLSWRMKHLGRGWCTEVLEKWWLPIHRVQSFKYKTGCMHGHVYQFMYLCGIVCTWVYAHVWKCVSMGLGVYLSCGKKNDCALVGVGGCMCICIFVCLYYYMYIFYQSRLLWGFLCFILSNDVHHLS